MNQWRALYAYSTAIEPLLLEVIGPFFERHRERLSHGFWERHYAGGPHVRIRLQAQPDCLQSLVAELTGHLEVWLAANPAPPLDGYSPQRAASLLAQEGIDPTTEELDYRHGVVREATYPEPGKIFASDGSRQLAEDFGRTSGPLALAILRSPHPRREETLRLFLTLAVFVGRGSYPLGCVSYKSHWEGFAATFPSEVVVERIRQSYQQHRERLLELVEEVETGWRAERFRGNSLLEPWWSLLQSTSDQATAFFESGQPLTDHPETPAQAAAIRDRLFTQHVRRKSDFMDILWRDEQFLTLIRHDVGFLRPRVLVNLLYGLVARLGLNPIEKMALCHHTYRAVEEARDCDLNVLLQHNIAALLERQAHRLGGSRKAEAAGLAADQYSGQDRGR